MLTKATARDAIVAALLRDAAAHEAGHYREIGSAYNDLDGTVPRGDDPDLRAVFVALRFWDGWIDARNHNWLYYDPVREEDWPRLARAVARDLAGGWTITDPIVLSHFDPQPRSPLWERLKALFRSAPPGRGG